MISNNRENMNVNITIQLFKGQKVRTAWAAERKRLYFAVVDITQVLTDSVNSRD